MPSLISRIPLEPANPITSLDDEREVDKVRNMGQQTVDPSVTAAPAIVHEVSRA